MYFNYSMITPIARGIMVCIGAFMYQCMLGTFYIWGTISVYVASYYRQYAPNITTQALGTFMPIRALLLMFLMPLGSYVDGKLGPRPVVLVGAIGMTTLVFALSYTQSPIMFVIFFSFAFGLPTIGFYIPVMCAWKYFPGERNVLTGISVCGFSLGPLIFTFISQKIVNPDNLSPKEYQNGALKEHYFDSEVYNNVPKLFLILGTIWGLIYCYIVFAIQNPSKEEALVLSALHQSSGRRGSAIDPINDCPSVMTAFRHKTFWILTILLTISTWSDFIFGLAYKELGFNYKYSDSYLTMVGILYSLANALGRIFWGFMSQKYSFIILYEIILAGQTLFALTLCTVANSSILYPLWIMLSTFFTCGNFVVFPPITLRIYGASYGQVIYTYIATAFAFGAFVLYFVNIYVLPYVGYKLMLEGVGMISGSGYLLLWLADLAPRWNTKSFDENNDIIMYEIEVSKKNKLIEA